MKKAILTASALVAVLVAGSASIAGAESGGKIAVSSKVSLSYLDPGNDPYGQSGFEGKVRAKKGCSVKRKVKIKGVGKAKTSKKGTFSISSSGSLSGTYQAKVSKTSVEKGETTIVCKAAKSKSVSIP